MSPFKCDFWDPYMTIFVIFLKGIELRPKFVSLQRVLMISPFSSRVQLQQLDGRALASS